MNVSSVESINSYFGSGCLANQKFDKQIFTPKKGGSIAIGLGNGSRLTTITKFVRTQLQKADVHLIGSEVTTNEVYK